MSAYHRPPDINAPGEVRPSAVRAPALQGRERSAALVIVAKYPEPGVVKTRLGSTIGNAQAAKLYRAFLGDLAARFGAAQATDGYRLCWAVAPGSRPVEALREVVGRQARILAQQGDDFAARLYAIAAAMRDAGYRRVAVMSSDAPHLPAQLVADAFAALDTTAVALAPAEDGGYSLIALCLDVEADAPPDLFRGIQMSTATVLAETLNRAAALGLSTTLLPISFDVDEASDLPRLWDALARDPTLAPRTYAALGALDAPLPTVTAQAAHDGDHLLAHPV